MNQKRILFVDDEPNILRFYERSLRREKSAWSLEFASCPVEAWKRIQSEPFDAVVSDVRMPKMTGIELLQNIKSNDSTKTIPVIIVTGEADRDLKRRALDFDADDLLSKPVDSSDLVARLKSALRTKDFADQLELKNEQLERRVRERTAELESSRIDILWRLGKAAEFRDEETGNHVIRVGSYSRCVALALGLDSDFVETLFLAAPLHDIGKIGIPDAVLLKPGKLTNHEWETMRRHCEYGASILSDESKFANVAKRYAKTGLSEGANHAADNSVIKMATQIAETHHEKWNGSGYPNQLKGLDIPIAGRIVAIVDVYDALRSERPYKRAFSVDESLEILKQESGAHFDPTVVSAFLEAFDEILEIEAEFRDPDLVHSQTDSPTENTALV